MEKSDARFLTAALKDMVSVPAVELNDAYPNAPREHTPCLDNKRDSTIQKKKYNLETLNETTKLSCKVKTPWKILNAEINTEIYQSFLSKSPGLNLQMTNNLI